MDKIELIINTAKEILLGHLTRGQTINAIGDEFKLLVTKISEAADSIEKISVSDEELEKRVSALLEARNK